MDKKAKIVLAVAMTLLILRLGITGAETAYERSSDFGQLFFDDDYYSEDLDNMGNALCESVFFGDKDCWASGICAAISQEGSQDDIESIEGTEGILVTVDEEGNLIVGAQLSAGRSPKILTFDEETGEEKWIRYYKVEYELRDMADDEDTTYSITLSSSTTGLEAKPVIGETIVDGNTTSYLGTDRIVFDAAGDYDEIEMTFSPKMRGHQTDFFDESTEYSSLSTTIANEGTEPMGGYGGQSHSGFDGVP